MLPDPRTSRSQDLLGLLSPPLALSVAAECLAGALVAGAGLGSLRAYSLAAASALIFSAGSVFGHYFDREADARHHAGRPLPRGSVGPNEAWQFGWMLLVPGVLLATPAGSTSLLAAIGTAMLVVLYAAATKSVWGAGFLTLGAARGVNLLLGLTSEELGAATFAAAALPVALYATGWAVLRSARQPGAPPATAPMALFHLVLALSVLLYQAQASFSYRVDSLLLLLPFLGLTLPRFVHAVQDGRRPALLKAVQYGFVGLTLLEGALVAGHAGFLGGLVIGGLALAVHGALRRWPVTLAGRSR